MLTDPYKTRFENELRKLGLDDAADLRKLDEASTPVQSAVLNYLGELAFAAQNVGNIIVGREALNNLPQLWLRERLVELFRPYLATDDEWEYRRIAEFLADWNSDELEAYLKVCERHESPDIQEIADEFRKKFG